MQGIRWMNPGDSASAGMLLPLASGSAGYSDEVNWFLQCMRGAFTVQVLQSRVPTGSSCTSMILLPAWAQPLQEQVLLLRQPGATPLLH